MPKTKAILPLQSDEINFKTGTLIPVLCFSSMPIPRLFVELHHGNDDYFTALGLINDTVWKTFGQTPPSVLRKRGPGMWEGANVLDC